MRNIDFATHYEALGLEPGASDQDIARAKRAYNELYHSDRLAHMSGAAQAIAAEKVRAANEAARVLLDPAMRAQRDQWLREARAGASHEAPGPQPSTAGPGPDSAPAAADVPEPRWPGPRSRRLLLRGLAAGALAGSILFLVVERAPRRNPPRIVTRPGGPPTTLPPADAPPGASTGPAPSVRTVRDSVITVPADGRWTAPVAVGGASYRGTFVPEQDNVMYRVRTDGRREYVLNSEPGFLQITETVRTYEFSSLTGKPIRIRYTRSRRNAPAGTELHVVTLHLPEDGGWSRRIWLGPLDLVTETDRRAGYEMADEEGRVSQVPPGVQSVAFVKQPVWIRFRTSDSRPLTLTVRYTAP